MKPKFKKNDIIIDPACGCKWKIVSVHLTKKAYRVIHASLDGNDNTFGWKIRDCDKVCKKIVDNERDAIGTKGIIISDNYTPYFRVYSDNMKEFVDYEIQHPDLEVRIIDTDAAFKNEGTNNPILDVSKKTLEFNVKSNKNKRKD